MFKNLIALFADRDLTNFDGALPREELIQEARIAFIDDEDALLLDELKRTGFAVDHDRSGGDLRNYDAQIYDVAIVDYHGVGKQLGPAQGLDLLKHLRRVSPRTRLVAYTSRSLSASESEFFRLSHVVLPKDLGLGDSLAIIEREIKKALSKEHLFEALITKLSITSGEDKQRMRSTLSKALAGKDKSKFREYVSKTVGVAAEKTVEVMISKLF